jgi:hypothetical protein
VLATGAGPEVARLLARAYRRLIARARVFRHDLTAIDLPEAVERELDAELGRFRVAASTWFIDLARGPDALWEGYAGRARTAVRKARRSGVTVSVETGPGAVETLHGLHRAQGRTRPVPWHHRREALGAVADGLGDDGRIWIARRGERAVAAALVVSRPGREAHPWITGAVPESRPVNAFQLLMHEAMTDAARRGIPLWNFGPSAGSEKVEFFKTAFGGRSHPLARYHHEARWVPWARRVRP